MGMVAGSKTYKRFEVGNLVYGEIGRKLSNLVAFDVNLRRIVNIGETDARCFVQVHTFFCLSIRPALS